MSERLLRLTEAAEFLGCSVQTVRRRIGRGELPAFRDGRILRLRPADLAGYVARRTTRPPRAPVYCATRVRAQAAHEGSLFDLPDPLR